MGWRRHRRTWHTLLIAGLQGNIVWYRNVGQRGGPRLESPRLLVPLLTRLPNTEVPTGHPGFHHAFCVADFNADGRLDLLVGDRFSREVQVSDQQRRQADANKERCAALREESYQLRRDQPPHETRAERIERHRRSLRTWQESETLRMTRGSASDTRQEQCGFVWYFERIGAR